jgi:hypothetical protein
MKERLIADWLTKAGERGGLDVVFCQILLSDGCKILRAGHSPTEAGKDIIALSRKGELRAYQVKSGNIDLKTFGQIQPQITNLVEAAVSHPNVRDGLKHRPYLVTTGAFSEPVQRLVQDLNNSWRKRKFKPLTLIGGSDLQPDLMKLAADFWPIEPPDIRSFLTLYLAEGIGDFDSVSFAEFLKRLFPEQGLSKTSVSRRIAAAGIFASYLLESFNLKTDHWSTFRGWTLTAAHQAWAAETYDLPSAAWESSFALTKAAAAASLKRLCEETLAERGLLPQGTELDEYTRARNTIAASAVAAWHLIQLRHNFRPATTDLAVSLVDRLVRKERLWFWGESAIPNILAVAWLLDRSGQTLLGERVLLEIIGGLAKRNQQLSANAFPSPHESPDDVLTGMFQQFPPKQRKPTQIAPASWSIEPLIHLLARRLRRQALASQWSEITRVDMATFSPARSADMLLWRCRTGEEATRLAGKPQSWRDLLVASRTNQLSELPSILRNDPDFSLMFMLSYPHRANRTLVKALDTWFC